MANSPGFVEHMSSHGARRVLVIPNGADPAMFDPDADGSELRRKLGLEGKFVVLYAGAHGVSNDLQVVLEAARLLADTDIRLVLLGDGKEKAALQRQAARMRLTNVIFADPVPKGEMPLALAAADACIAILRPLPEYRTTYPNKVFDYMAAGRPVLLVIDGAIRRVVENAICGVYSEPGDPQALARAITELAHDRRRARQLGRNGRIYLEKNFSREAAGDTLLRLLADLVGTGANPASG
jgi:glycosyltransferase involved in cell wall biosynthesis